MGGSTRTIVRPARIGGVARPTRGEVLVGLALALAVVVYAVNDTYLLDRVCYNGTLVAAGIGAWIGAERAPPRDPAGAASRRARGVPDGRG